MPSRRPPLRGAALAAALALAGGAGARGEPTLLDLALAWARGEYRGPIVCQHPDGPRRVARRVLIKPGDRDSHRRNDEVVFFPLPRDGSEVARCFTELGAPEPDVEGRLRISLSAHQRPDLARVEFGQALKREGGFAFEVVSGRLRVQDPEAAPREVDLAGGQARLTGVPPGSDAARLLREFGDAPKRTLRVEARDGTQLVFHLIQTGRR